MNGIDVKSTNNRFHHLIIHSIVFFLILAPMPIQLPYQSLKLHINATYLCQIQLTVAQMNMNIFLAILGIFLTIAWHKYSLTT